MRANICFPRFCESVRREREYVPAIAIIHTLLTVWESIFIRSRKRGTDRSIPRPHRGIVHVLDQTLLFTSAFLPSHAVFAGSRPHALIERLSLTASSGRLHVQSVLPAFPET